MDNLIIQNVSDYLGYTREQCLKLSSIAPKTYRHYSIPKKKSGSRKIHHPAKTTKALQYSIIETFLIRFPIHENAYAYKRDFKSPIQKNAIRHSKYKYSLKIDFKDFFHSICPDDLFHVIVKEMSISPEDCRFLENCLFVNTNYGKGLAIGAPSSPIVSNIVMHEFDEMALNIAHRIDGKSIYTRYADDIAFSTNVRGACTNYLSEIESLVRKLKHPSLTINNDKTMFCSKGSRRVITGIFITPEGGVSIGRKNKRFIKKLVFDLLNNIINDEEVKYLRGYLAYIRDVEPQFFNRLLLKYGADILDKLK